MMMNIDGDDEVVDIGYDVDDVNMDIMKSRYRSNIDKIENVLSSER